jgi:hypothetical protein
MSGHWIAVAAAEHVQRGRLGGFMQVCHGKSAPLRRIKPGDGVAYYSPATSFRGQDRLQAFTAIGHAGDGEPYQVDMGDGFQPFRRDMDWLDAMPASIRPLLDQLDFCRGQPAWGQRLRFGLLSVSAQDFQLIAQAMGARLPSPA